jgi:predicted ATPase
VAGLLDSARLVTLVGPGGIGKTRLSLSVAADTADSYDDGVVFVPLAEITAAELVVAAVARALRVDEVPGQPLPDALAERLADASMLLVLDNFEQVMDAADLVGDLLAAAPGVCALVTSRERLGLYGEQVYQVPPLPLPEAAALRGGVAGALAASPAVALFDERARAADPEFTLTAGLLPPVVELCRRLDGLPLAIELAAAQVYRLSPPALLAHLGAHLDALGDGPRNLPARQQTLRGAVDWSYVLLDAEDQRLFSTVAVFAGGADVDAAATVVGRPAAAQWAPHRTHVAARLAALAERSLLVAEDDPHVGVRYRMLETIRAYASARLAERADAGAVRARHADYCADFTERSAAGLASAEQAVWVGRVEREYVNLRAAFDWATGGGDAATGARICLGLWRYWRTGSHIGEGRDWLARVLAGACPDDAERAQLLHAAAVLAATQDDHEPAYRYAYESLARAEATGDRRLTAQARNALGMAATGAGDYEAATGHFRHCLAAWEELGQPPGIAIALGNLTKVSLKLGDVEAAAGYAHRVLALERAAGNTHGIVLGLECLGQILLAQGDAAAARAALHEGLGLSRSLGDAYGEAMALHQLGVAAQLDGDRDEALRLLADALARRHEMGDREDLAASLDSIAGLAVERDAALAARLLAAAEALRAAHRLPSPPDGAAQRRATGDIARRRLGPAAFAAAWAAGRGTPLDLVVDQALELAPAA